MNDIFAERPVPYYSKCPFCSQNLIFGTSGSFEQFQNSMKKHLNLCKTQKKTPNAFGSVLKVKIAGFQLLGWQSDVAPSSDSNLQFNFFQRHRALSHVLYKIFVCHQFATRQCSAFLMIITPHCLPLVKNNLGVSSQLICELHFILVA